MGFCLPRRTLPAPPVWRDFSGPQLKLYFCSPSFANTDTSPWVGAPDASSSWFDHICKDPHFQITSPSQVKTSKAWVNGRRWKPQSLSEQDMSQNHGCHGALSTASPLLIPQRTVPESQELSTPVSLLSPFSYHFKKMHGVLYC